MAAGAQNSVKLPSFPLSLSAHSEEGEREEEAFLSFRKEGLERGGATGDFFLLFL